MPFLHGLVRISFVAAALLLGVPASAAIPPAAEALIKARCLECHTGPESERGVDLQALLSEADPAKARKQWKAVSRQLQSNTMPPADSPQPDAAERKSALDAIRGLLDAAKAQQGIEPGQVTVRRLNRVEYNNTLRDLLGVTTNLSADFPSDDVGYGFDNIGDVLSMPPLLFEKYVAAAEKAVDLALGGDPSAKQLFNSPASRLEFSGGRQDGEAVLFTSSGRVSVELEFPAAGRYDFEVVAFGDQAGDEPCKMQFSLDNDVAHVWDVPVRREDPGAYRVSRDCPAGKHRVSLAFINDYWNPAEPDASRRDRNLYIEHVTVMGPLDGIAGDTRKLLGVRTPKPGREADAARVILEKFLRRAYRRPVKEGEAAALVQVAKRCWDGGDSFEQGLGTAFAAALVSPQFLYRIEPDPPGAKPGDVRELDEHELAVRLSYFLWNSMPDEELFRLADAGQLRAEMPQQIQRMLADAKSRSFVESFAGQWLQLRSLDRLQPDKRQFGRFDSGLKDAMRRETELFFEDIVKEDRSVLLFLSADYTFLNQRLARHYGINGIKGREFARVELKNPNRGGILTQASVLSVTSNPTRTSPVKRGKWVLENLLGAPPPPPPPNVPELSEAKDKQQSGSLRQRMEQHRANPMCASCHAQLDPLGFGLENFDAIGAWRDKDGEFPVDASGELPDGTKFSGPAELKNVLLSRKDEFVRCLAEKLLTYALGRGLEDFDEAAVDAICSRAAAHDLRMRALIEAVIMSEPFQKRRVPENVP